MAFAERVEPCGDGHVLAYAFLAVFLGVRVHVERDERDDAVRPVDLLTDTKIRKTVSAVADLADALEDAASPFVMRLLVWSLVAREADLQWRYAIRMYDGYEDAGNVELAAGLDAGQVKRIVDDETLDGLPTRLFDFDVKEER